MSRRNKPYRIRLSSTRRPHAVPARFFYRFIALGWLVAAGVKMAELRKGVSAWVEDGKLRLQDKEAGKSISIPCSWAWVERAALYSQSGPKIGTKEYEWAIQEHHCER